MEKAKNEIRKGARMNKVEISEDVLDRIHPPFDKEHHVENVGYKDLYNNACIRKRILLMFVQWIAAVLCYNGLLFNSVNIGSNVYVSMALGVIIEVIGSSSALETYYSGA